MPGFNPAPPTAGDRLYTNGLEGLLLQPVPNNTSKYRVGAGRYQVVDSDGAVTQIAFSQTDYSFPELLKVDENKAVYLWIGANRVPTFTLRAPDQTKPYGFICLGAISSQDNATISNITPMMVGDDPETRALLKSNPVRVPFGSLLLPRPFHGTLSFSHGDGEVIAVGRNWHNDANNPHVREVLGRSPFPFTLLDQSGALIERGRSEFDFTKADQGNGNILNLRNRNASAQRVYISAAGNIAVVLGATRYTNLNQAIERWQTEDYDRPANLSGFAYLCAVLGSANATTTSDRSRVVVVRPQADY